MRPDLRDLFARYPRADDLVTEGEIDIRVWRKQIKERLALRKFGRTLKEIQRRPLKSPKPAPPPKPPKPAPAPKTPEEWDAYKELKRGLRKGNRRRLRMWIAQKEMCPYCDKHIDNFKTATFEHLVPVSRGGKTLPRHVNLILVHQKCNSIRGNAITLEEALKMAKQKNHPFLYGLHRKGYLK